MKQETFNQRFGRKMAIAMAEKKISQIDLSYEIGTTQSAISAYISGKNAPRLATALKICAYLGIDLEVFI
jgi:transcriptional regulator with XRE-family HTH domain